MSSDSTAKNWNISGAFSLGANLLVAVMPYLPHTSASHQLLTGPIMSSVAAGLQTTGAVMCIFATGILAIRGDHALFLRMSKGLIAFANILFGVVGKMTANPFMIGMALLGLTASLIPQISQQRWPVKIKMLDTPPKMAAILGFPNVATQIGSAVTKDPYWLGVAAFCIAKMIYQYLAPAVDKLSKKL